MMDSENIGGGVETGSTGERDMHSDATSVKHSNPQASVTKQEDRSSSSDDGSGRESGLSLPRIDNHVVDGHGGLYGTEDSTPPSESAGNASDFQSAEGLASDMPDRKGIREPPSTGDRATDITGIAYIQ